jgi:hypothetical protein
MCIYEFKLSFIRVQLRRFLSPTGDKKYGPGNYATPSKFGGKFGSNITNTISKRRFTTSQLIMSTQKKSKQVVRNLQTLSLPHTNAHIHTHTRTHTHTHTHTHTLIHKHTTRGKWSHSSAYTHINTHTSTLPHTFTLKVVRRHTRQHIYSRATVRMATRTARWRT